MKFTTIKNRAFKALNLKQYRFKNKPVLVDKLDLEVPTQRQYILRMLINRPNDGYGIPAELDWCKPLIEKAISTQKELGISQPFCYITVRNGVVDSVTDDVWHVDGFSLNITHLPEQNYLWSNHTPTEYVTKPVNFPPDFDGRKHNIHSFMSNRITDKDKIMTMKSKVLYCLDPYVIHRRPKLAEGTVRSFVRISFTPIEISDSNNTINPLLPTSYKRDGILEFRNNLTDYDK